MVTLDIFFIDFERPKFNTVCSDHFTTFNGSNKSQPGTPSIASSVLKPPTSPANYECVSAWRNYFIANEWQELIAKRKISIHLHIISVIAFLMVSLKLLRQNAETQILCVWNFLLKICAKTFIFCGDEFEFFANIDITQTRQYHTLFQYHFSPN
jgi:hypothetical protein